MRQSTQALAKPTDFELELLNLLWRRKGATVRELHEELSQVRQMGYTSVLKTLQIMTEKGLVQREESNRAHIYRAARSEQQTKKQFVSDLTNRLFSGSAAQLALHALSTHTIEADEFRLIKELIDQKGGRS